MIDRAATSDSPLARLKALHGELNSLLEELQTLTGCHAPNGPRIATVRLCLSKASRKRTNLLHTELYDRALALADPSERGAIEALQQEDAHRLRNSSDHVNCWTLSHITDDWAGYRTASSAMRDQMRRRIAAEEQALYTALSRAETGTISRPPASATMPRFETSAPMARTR